MSPELKQRIFREIKNFAIIFIYLALVLGLLAVHKAFILRGNPLIGQLLALFNALVLGKIIIILEYFRVGEMLHHRLPILRIILKSLLFGLLLLAFHILETGIRGWFHGRSFAEAISGIDGGRLIEMSTLAFIMVVSLLPYFTLREITAVVGEKRLLDILFRPTPKTPPGE